MLINQKININLFYYLSSLAIIIYIFFQSKLNSFEESKYELLVLLIFFLISVLIEDFRNNIFLKILIFHFFVFYIFRIPFSITQDNQIFDIRFVNQLEIQNSITYLIFQYLSIYSAILIINPKISFRNNLSYEDKNSWILNCLIYLIFSLIFLNFLFNLFGTINYENFSKYLAIFFNIFNSKRLVIVFTTLIFFSYITKSNIKNLKILAFVFYFIYLLDTIYIAGSRSSILLLCLLFYLLSLYYFNLNKISLKIIILSILFLPLVLFSFFLSTFFKNLLLRINHHKAFIEGAKCCEMDFTSFDYFRFMFNDVFSLMFISITDRMAYLNFYIEKLSNKRMYEDIINLNYYFKSFIDRVTPGVDFFNIPLAAKDMQRAYGQKAFEEGLISKDWISKVTNVTNSEQITIFAETQILFSHYSIFFYLIFFFVIKRIIKLFENYNFIYKQLINTFFLTLFFDWLTGFGMDFFSMNLVYSAFFLIIIISATNLFHKLSK